MVASEAVPTPASTITGTEDCSFIKVIFILYYDAEFHGPMDPKQKEKMWGRRETHHYLKLNYSQAKAYFKVPERQPLPSALEAKFIEDEAVEGEPLLQPAVQAGARLQPRPDLNDTRALCLEASRRLPAVACRRWRA